MRKIGECGVLKLDAPTPNREKAKEEVTMTCLSVGGSLSQCNVAEKDGSVSGPNTSRDMYRVSALRRSAHSVVHLAARRGRGRFCQLTNRKRVVISVYRCSECLEWQ